MAIMSLVQYQFGMLCCIRYLLPRSTFTAVLLTYSFSNYKQRYFIPLIKYEGTHFMEAFAHLWIKYLRQCARTSWVFVRDLLYFALPTSRLEIIVLQTWNIQRTWSYRPCIGSVLISMEIWKTRLPFCEGCGLRFVLFLIRTTSAGVSGWRYVREGASWGCV